MLPAGANSCIRKPIDFREFAETVRATGRYWLTLNRPAQGGAPAGQARATPFRPRARPKYRFLFFIPSEARDQSAGPDPGHGDDGRSGPTLRSR